MVFKKDDRVKHPFFGYGMVLEDEYEGTVKVIFKRKGETNLMLKYAALEHLSQEEKNALEKRWLDTFEMEGEGAEHFWGARFEPFFDAGAEEVLERLPEIGKEARRMLGYGDLLQAPRPVPPEWLEASYVAWPDQQAGIQLALVKNQDNNELISMFPFIRSGSQHLLGIERVIVFENGIEAQIEATLACATIVFFDILFISNRAWYHADEMYEFLLAGIAYGCRPATSEPLVLNPPPEWLVALRRQGKSGETDVEPEDPMVVRTEGMAVLNRVEEWDRDDYSFRGPVKEVRELEFLGEQAWLVRTIVIRDPESGQEIDLNILVSRRVWDSDTPPEVDTDIEGTLWLQGHLWSTEVRDDESLK